jgi:UDP-N-acetylmuramyl pentapeptide synthase
MATITSPLLPHAVRCCRCGRRRRRRRFAAEWACHWSQVAETRLSLGALAADWRCRFTLPLIAVTGSNGKTTTKEMIASILNAALATEAVLSTHGNYNNDIGLPLTLLRLNATHRAAIIEMGMNHPGEIAYLAGIARPDGGPGDQRPTRASGRDGLAGGDCRRKGEHLQWSR